VLAAATAKLASQLVAPQAYIKKLKEEIAELKAKMKPAWQGRILEKMTSNDSYC
jgi:hypothetical protein